MNKSDEAIKDKECGIVFYGFNVNEKGDVYLNIVNKQTKQTLVNHGFRLPSALDNRPLQFDEFEEKLDKVIYLSATPGPYELEKELPIIEQIIRPTYLLDPEIEIRKKENQMEHHTYLLAQCKNCDHR